MIRLLAPGAAAAPLSAAESYGLSVLVDLSRLLILDSTERTPDREPVTVTVVDGGEWSASALLRGDYGYAVHEGSVGVPRALLDAVTEIAGAALEQRSTGADRHGRVPSAENPLVAGDCSRDPVVSRAAVALRRAVIQAAGPRPVRVVAPWPARSRWAIALTHDLDVGSLWPAFAALRVAELARKGAIRDAGRVIGAGLASALTQPLVGSPVRRAVRRILDIERHAGVPSTWYVIAGVRTLRTLAAGDVTYTAGARAVRRLLHALAGDACEIGLHGSFATGMSDTAVAFAAERHRLGAAIRRGEEDAGTERYVRPALSGVRQHYLRMRPGKTQRRMIEAGFSYDATYGYPDRNGFRLGVADVVPGWDATAERATSLAEVPLTWMDRAQSKYQGIEDPARWIEDAIELAQSCQEVDGLWVGLWHPNMTPALGFPGAPAAYERLVTLLTARAPYAATVGDIVAWRRLRSAVRARGVGPDGRVVLDGPPSRALEVLTDDGAGRSAEVLSTT
jgi:peptidoglycan/xylan/chitin deacetylase (PgdA/CDA1 family)